MKSISAGLLAHKSSPGSTLCYLLLIGPLPDASYLGLTSLDVNVTYNPGTYDFYAPNVLQTFYAATGADLSNFQSANDLTVNNGETQTLVEQYPGQGVTVAMVDNGDLDGVEYSIYQVNYRDLTMGHEVMGNGPLGEVRIQSGGLVTFECRSWADLLRQNSVVELDSLTCRVKRFGSQLGDELFPCMYDLTGEWVTAQTVTSLGAESVRQFTASGLGQAQDYFAPGLVLWLTGDNARMSREIESFNFGGAVDLRFVTRHPINVGDTFDIRRDCTRKWAGPNSCNTYSNRPYFRGEPFIPVSDTIGLTVPGAAAGGWGGIGLS